MFPFWDIETINSFGIEREKAIFQKEKESNSIKTLSFTKLSSNVDSLSSTILNSMWSFSKSIAFFLPLGKRKPPFVPSLDPSAIFPRFTSDKKKRNAGKPHDDARRFSQPGRKRSESVGRGRIRMERYSSQTDLGPFTPELARVFVVAQGGRGGTGNPGLTYFQPQQAQMVESASPRDRVVNTA